MNSHFDSLDEELDAVSQANCARPVAIERLTAIAAQALLLAEEAHAAKDYTLVGRLHTLRKKALIRQVLL